MKDVIVGLAAIVIGGVFCFWGYFAMRLVIPIWGFFAGFVLGAGATSWIDNSEFLSTVLGWVLGFFIGLLFAVIAYLFYEIAIVLTFAAIGSMPDAALFAASTTRTIAAWATSVALLSGLRVPEPLTVCSWAMKKNAGLADTALAVTLVASKFGP